MHKLESVVETNTQKLHQDFEIQTDHPISARRRPVKKKKKKKRTGGLMDFTVQMNHSVKI